MSFIQGVFQVELKYSSISSIIRNSGADSKNVKHYKSISDTPNLTKIIAKAALHQINTFMVENVLHTATQTGYKNFHFYKTVDMRTVNDTQRGIKKRKLCRTAFGVIDQCLLTGIMKKTCGCDGKVILWI